MLKSIEELNILKFMLKDLEIEPNKKLKLTSELDSVIEVFELVKFNAKLSKDEHPGINAAIIDLSSNIQTFISDFKYRNVKTSKTVKNILNSIKLLKSKLLNYEGFDEEYIRGKDVALGIFILILRPFGTIAYLILLFKGLSILFNHWN